MTFTNDKFFGLVDTHQVGLEDNTACVSRQWGAQGSTITTIHKTSSCGFSILTYIVITIKATKFRVAIFERYNL